MEACILNGVGKKLRNDYLNGKVPESTVIAQYKKHKKEADEFSVFGYKTREIEKLLRETKNPLLKQKLEACLREKQAINKRSNEQNNMNLLKLERFKQNACGVGLRKVLRRMRQLSKQTKDTETILLTLLLETEFANLSAKQHKGDEKAIIYERKSILLYNMASYLKKAGWKYGINDEAGKNACYLVYVYLPNGVQLTWHCNEYDIYKSYPVIDAEWDGQVCMTMEKILTYIEEKYYSQKAQAA